MKFSIVIPFFNEEENIKPLIDEIQNSLKINKFEYELILINDHSTDATLQLLNEIKNKLNIRVEIINNHTNLGQSLSIYNGIKQSNYDVIVTLDGDGQNNPINIPFLVETYFLEKNISLIGGIRVKRKDKLIKRVSSRIANKIRSAILNDNCSDTGCSLKVFDKRVFLSFPYFDGIHRFLPALFSGYSKNTMFINVDHRPRKYGYSKYGTMKRLLKGIIDIFRVIIIINRFKKKDV